MSFDDSLQSKSALLLRHGVVLPAALESEMRTLDDSAPAVSAARFWVLREEQRTLLGFASVEAAARQNPIQSKRYQAGTKRYQVGTKWVPSGTKWVRMASDVQRCWALLLRSYGPILEFIRLDADKSANRNRAHLRSALRHTRTHAPEHYGARDVGHIGICRVPLLRSFPRGFRCWSFPLCCQLAKESHDV